MKIFSLYVVFVFIAALAGFAQNNEAAKDKLVYQGGDYQFEWDFQTDKARMSKSGDNSLIWQGSLLPAFCIEQANQERYIKAMVTGETTQGETITLALRFGDLATGSLAVKKESWGISVMRFQVNWLNQIPKIKELFFGTSTLPAGRQSLMSEDNPGFSSDWDAFGFCLPGAKEGPVQSYFRFWDFGQTNIALGSFGPSMGIPYGAAFPRPILSVAMGNDKGWMIIGAGSLPDAPMTLKMRSSLGCVSFLYREDIWGVGNRERTWKDVLRISFGDSSWNSFRSYFNSFPEKEPISSIHQKAIWNTWGNWRNKEYPIRPMGDFAKKVDAEIFVIDDPWEASQGLGNPDIIKFPLIHADLDYLHKTGMAHGIWETLGWIGDTVACGLTKADLICGKNGQPCIGSWNFNPFASGYFCLDISSEHAREFLKKRTLHTMKLMKPKLIKLDFGYGMPNPNMGVPRNPELRGERYTYELMKLIVEAAKSIDPEVTIMYYGINPLYLSLADMISLDDQGDLWYEVKSGHDQWSIWASLLSDKQVAISGSSSYDWFTDDEVILNTFILGSPGAVLGTHLDDKSPVPDQFLNRRLAVNKWHRKSIVWKPVWLNSSVGNLLSPPKLNCWARTEHIDEKDQITALVLRGEKDKTRKELEAFEWEGRWAVISQTNAGILAAKQIAIVPFDTGYISVKLSQKPVSVKQFGVNGSNDFLNWKWENNKLIIRINKGELNQIAGFLIDSK